MNENHTSGRRGHKQGAHQAIPPSHTPPVCLVDRPEQPIVLQASSRTRQCGCPTVTCGVVDRAPFGRRYSMGSVRPTSSADMHTTTLPTESHSQRKPVGTKDTSPPCHDLAIRECQAQGLLDHPGNLQPIPKQTGHGSMSLTRSGESCPCSTCTSLLPSESFRKGWWQCRPHHTTDSVQILFRESMAIGFSGEASEIALRGHYPSCT